jgi:hypothetical protein
MTSAGRLGEFLAQFADEHVDDLDFGLVHSAIEVIEDHRLRHGRTLALGQQFEDAVLPTGEMHRLVIDRHDSLIEIYHYLARLDPRCIGLLVRGVESCTLVRYRIFPPSTYLSERSFTGASI